MFKRVPCHFIIRFPNPYLQYMEHKELVLSTLAQMAKESTQPTLHQFIPRELILPLPIYWSTIYSCLCLLEEDVMV